MSTFEGEHGPDRPGEIALALSGGGSRAIAFHLGCLRALYRNGLLEKIDTICSVSGGSVLAALYCTHEGDFKSFEARVRAELAQGFVARSVKVALTTAEGVMALGVFGALVAERTLAAALSLALIPFPTRRARIKWLASSAIRRSHSRTTILRRVFAKVLQHAALSDLRDDRPKLIILACELRTKSAFYFAKDGMGSWRLGNASSRGVSLAQAVAASAAYPVALPALDESITFTRSASGQKSEHRERVILTDGGVYDNLGLSPFWPGRESRISLHVREHRNVIACRAGYGLDRAPAASLWPSRMIGTIESLAARAQNAAINRLFDLQRAGVFDRVIMPYLDQEDRELVHRAPDDVRREEVSNYPTDFSPMASDWIDRLIRRGDEQVEALLKQYFSL